MKTINTAMYDEAKKTLKAQMDEELAKFMDGKKLDDLSSEEKKVAAKLTYPQGTNNITEYFIIKRFAPIVAEISKKNDTDDFNKLLALYTKFIEDQNDENAKSKNSFPTFRADIGKYFFPEFNKTKATKKAKVEETRNANLAFLNTLVA